MMVKTSREIREMFASVPFTILGDARYAVPTLEYVTDELLPAFEAWMKGLGIWDWHRRHDCDDKADALKMFAQICFFNTHGVRDDVDGLAIGRVWYKIGGDPKKGHAINWMLCDEGLLYVEPQSASMVELTEDELWSRYFIH